MKATTKRIAKGLCFFLILVSVSGCTGSSSQVDESKDTEITKNFDTVEDVQDAGSSTDYDENIQAEKLSSFSLSDYQTEENLISDWEETQCTKITLNGDEVTIDGSGALWDNGQVIISSAGRYLISGILNDGSIVVNAGGNDLVHLILNGVTLASSTTSPLYMTKAGKTIITLAEGTENTVTDAADYMYESEEADVPNAAIYSKDDLVINGSGKLTVNGNYNNGITSRDDLIIAEAEIYVISADDGLLGRDHLIVLSGYVHIESGDDGLKSSNSSKGVIAIASGSVTVESDGDAIQSVNAVYIENGTLILTSGGGSQDSSAKSGRDDFRPGGRGTTDEESDAASTKGIKAENEIYIADGQFTINTLDDAIHCNGNVMILDGKFTIASGDDGIHADDTIDISGGNILITQSYEGIEASKINISGGYIDLTASDDGINVAGGNDSSSMGGRSGENSFSSSSDNILTVTGGTIVVDAAGDGIDVNGTAYVYDGEIYVHGPTSSGDGALDYDNEFIVYGGTIVAIGSMGMDETPSSSSEQYCIHAGFDTMQEAGSVITVKNSVDETILSFTSRNTFQSLVYTSAEIRQGENYSIDVNGEEVIASFEITDIITTAGNVRSMGGGRPGQGGGPPDGSQPGGSGGKEPGSVLDSR